MDSQSIKKFSFPKDYERHGKLCYFYVGQKKSWNNGFRWENFLSKFKTWKLLPVILIVDLSSKSNHETNEQ